MFLCYCCEPDITMLKPKLVKVPVLDATVSVSVADTIESACKEAPALFYINIKEEAADDGFQSDTVMLSVSVVLPVFFT